MDFSLEVVACTCNFEPGVNAAKQKSTDIFRKLGASEGTINQEIQRYQQLESVAVNDIRRDVRKKLRRSSMRVSHLIPRPLFPLSSRLNI